MDTDRLFSCAACNFSDYEVIFSYDKPDKYEEAAGICGKNYFREWVRCKECGLIFSIYSRDQRTLENIYVGDYRSKDSPWRVESNEAIFNKIIMLPPEESETIFRVNWVKNNIRKLRETGIIKRGDSPYCLLDVGGGTGVFAYCFLDKDWRVSIIDPDKNARFLETKHNIPCVQSGYKPKSFEKSFHLISLIFVLEHVTSPDKVLNDVRSDLRKDGLVYIEVPDSICFKLKPAHDDIFNACHLWMFSPKTLNDLLYRCGFEILAMERTKTRRGHYSLMVLGGQV